MFLSFIHVIPRISSFISVNCQTINSTWLSHISIHQLMKLWVLSTLRLLKILLWTLIYKFLCGHAFVFLWLDFILRINWLISPFLGLCSDCPFGVHSFFFLFGCPPFIQTWCPVSSHPWSFPDCPVLIESFQPFSSSLWRIFYPLILHCCLFFHEGEFCLSIHWFNREYLLICTILDCINGKYFSLTVVRTQLSTFYHTNNFSLEILV